MDRRGLLRSMPGVFIGLGIAGCSGDDSGGDGGSDWETDKTVSGGGQVVHSVFIGEMEEESTVEVEVIVEQGRATRFDLMNRDTGDIPTTLWVYRSEEIEGYNAEEDAASPYRDTITIPDFGEYEIRVTTPRENDEVTVRFARR